MKSKLESSDAQRKGSPAALAGETRTEAQDSMLIHILVQKEKEGKGEEAWVAHCLELDLVGVDDSKWKSVEKLALLINRQIDFAIRNGHEDVIWFPAPQKFFDEYAAAAESRIAQLAKFKQYVHKRLDDFGVPSDPDPEHNKVHGCRIEGRLNFAFARAETAEAALTQAHKAIELGKNAIILTGVADTEITGLVDKESAKKFLKAVARVYEQVKEKI